MNKIEELKAEIAAKIKELEQLEKEKEENVLVIIQKSKYTDKEKIGYFNEIHDITLSIIKEAEENGYKNDNTDHYCFEQELEILNTNKTNLIWDYYKKLVR